MTKKRQYAKQERESTEIIYLKLSKNKKETFRFLQKYSSQLIISLLKIDIPKRI